MASPKKLAPNEWLMPYNTGFHTWVKERFATATVNVAAASSSSLYSHQVFVKNFMDHQSPYRGLVLYHGLGVGKTLSSIEIAKSNPDRSVVVMLPASLEPNFKSEVKKAGYSGRISYIHYNGGFNKNNIAEFIKAKPFDNKLVIIDEVHNFISRVVGSGDITKQLYQTLMEAHNVRIVALSGTPIINNPREIMYLLNLLRGYLYSHKLTFKGACDATKLKKDILALDCVTTAWIATGSINVVLTPVGYAKGENGISIVRMTAMSATQNVDSHDQATNNALSDVHAVMRKYKLKPAEATRLEKATLFPFKDEDVDTWFIDYHNLKCLNDILFLRRSQGLVSYFESYDKNVYPTQRPIRVVDVPMSNTQCYAYVEMRQQEIEKEKKARMFGNGKDSGDTKSDIKNGNPYRSFSRALCNFVFPEEIKRPYPSTLKEFKKDVDEAKDDILVKKGDAIATEKSKRGKGVYERAIAKALGQLSAEHLSPEGMRTYGPKMQAIIDNVNASPGPALVYSVFRNVEGLKVLSMAFDAQGYAELQVKKDMGGKWHLQCSDMSMSKPKYIVFTDQRDEVDILLDIFNSDFEKLPPTLLKDLKKMGIADNIRGDFVRVLMITQSGSEGISLKNVRQAHVMEPYWNDIRVKQVFGRAVRANSHAALPKKERIVDTFIYITRMTDKQIAANSLVANYDQSKTSDGYIYDIAARKAVINDQFLQMLKNASVDCMVNKAVHKTAVQCFKPPAQKDKSAPTYHLGSMVRDHDENKVLAQPVTTKVQRQFKPMKALHSGRALVLLMNPTADDQAIYERHAPRASTMPLGWQGIYYKDDAEMGSTFVLVGLYEEDPATKKKGVIWVIKPK